MQGLVAENSTVAGRSPNAIACPEWLEQKLLDDMRSAYTWTVSQAAAGRGLKEMEQGLRERVMGIGAKLLQASLARGYGSGHTAGSLPCAGCSGRMRYVMERDKIITSWFQEIRLKRAYYHCRRCKAGMVPLDKQLDVVGTSFSPTVREAICLVNAEVSFERGQDLLERLTGIRMSVEEGRLIAEDQGRALEHQDQAEIEKAWQAKAPKPREACLAPQRLYVSPDGTHIPILGQKEWSEVKVATIFTASIPSSGNILQTAIRGGAQARRRSGGRGCRYRRRGGMDMESSGADLAQESSRDHRLLPRVGKVMDCGEGGVGRGRWERQEVG